MKKILLVDDDEAVLELVSAILGYDGRYLFITARDGEEALEAVHRNKPDLVLLDILMPKKDGYHVCQALKKDPGTAQIKVLVLTALTQETELQRVLQSGADGYVTKPFSPVTLLEKLEESLTVA